MPFTQEEFLDRVIKKYPEYGSWDRGELYARFLKKYPEYIPQITDYTEQYAKQQLEQPEPTQESPVATERTEEPVTAQIEQPVEPSGGGIATVYGPTLEELQRPAPHRNRVDRSIAGWQHVIDDITSNMPQFAAEKFIRNFKILGTSLIGGTGEAIKLAGAGMRFLGERGGGQFTGYAEDPVMQQYLDVASRTQPEIQQISPYKSYIEFGKIVRDYGADISERNRTPYDLKEFEWTDLATPEFYMSKGARSLPLVMPLIGASAVAFPVRRDAASRYAPGPVREAARTADGVDCQLAGRRTGRSAGL